MKRIEELQQLREMDLEELNDQADALKESLFRLKFRKSLGAGEVVARARQDQRELRRLRAREAAPRPGGAGRR